MSSEDAYGIGSEEGVRPVAIRARGLTKAYSIYQRPGLRLKQLLWIGTRKFYDEFVAIRDIDLEIQKGETVGIVGRNGSGKSTLLNLICGTLEKTSGELKVEGHLAPILALGAGFDPEFSGRENVFMNAAIMGLSRSEIRDRIDSIADFSLVHRAVPGVFPQGILDNGLSGHDLCCRSLPLSGGGSEFS